MDFVEKSAYPWDSMTGFVAEFQQEFYPISADEDALVVLEGSSYFQKSGELVDSYICRPVPGTLQARGTRGRLHPRHQTVSGPPSVHCGGSYGLVQPTRFEQHGAMDQAGLEL